MHWRRAPGSVLNVDRPTRAQVLPRTLAGARKIAIFFDCGGCDGLADGDARAQCRALHRGHRARARYIHSVQGT